MYDELGFFIKQFSDYTGMQLVIKISRLDKPLHGGFKLILATGKGY